MPAVHPFHSLHFSRGPDQSPLVAPPYDVLDATEKSALLAGDPHNIVAVDLPHTPAKELGPPAAYTAAADTFRHWLSDGTLTRSPKPAMFAYRQTFKSEDGAHTIQRSGMACTIETVPFGPRAGGGILPHEETFSGPKADRLALMQATRAQLSPIFGLIADDLHEAGNLLREIMTSRPADRTATTPDGTFHEVWTVDDPEWIKEYQNALVDEDIYVADGHHRYNTALNYLQQLETQSGAALPPDHPARRTMIVLVSMSDPGLVIWPTHRILGGMQSYEFREFLAAMAADGFRISAPTRLSLDALCKMPAPQPAPSGDARNVLTLYDFATESCAVAELPRPDPLAALCPTKHPAWRKLDVAIIQHLIVEQICQPLFNNNQPVKWAFPHTVQELADIGRGHETGAGGGATFGRTGPQLGIIIRPTPLQAVREVSKSNQLMPQKSTFFYPKLATGLFMLGLE